MPVRARSEKPLAKSWDGSKLIFRAMSLNEILKELPKLTQDEKRQLWNVLDQELSSGQDEESPQVLAAIERGIRSLEAGERTHTLEEARQRVKEIVAKARQ
jgi:hypothetical protein